MPVVLSLSGKTGLDMELVAHVHAQFPGKVVQVGPQLGDVVKGPDDPGGPTQLCVIESTDLAGAKSDYLKAQVQLKLDQENLARTQELVKSTVLAEKFLLDAQSAVTKDAADLEAARQKLKVFGLSDAEIEAAAEAAGSRADGLRHHQPALGRDRREGRLRRRDRRPHRQPLHRRRHLEAVGLGRRLRARPAAAEGGAEGGGLPDLAPRTSRTRRRSTGSAPCWTPTRAASASAARWTTRTAGCWPRCTPRCCVTVDDGRDSIIVPADAVVRKRADAFVFVRAGAADKARRTFQRRAVKVEPVDAGPGLSGSPPAASGQRPGAAPAQRRRRRPATARRRGPGARARRSSAAAHWGCSTRWKRRGK